MRVRFTKSFSASNKKSGQNHSLINRHRLFKNIFHYPTGASVLLQAQLQFGSPGALVSRWSPLQAASNLAGVCALPSELSPDKYYTSF